MRKYYIYVVSQRARVGRQKFTVWCKTTLPKFVTLRAEAGQRKRINKTYAHKHSGKLTWNLTTTGL